MSLADEYREVHLVIDGGIGRTLPVRCGGSVENGTFTINEVWVDIGPNSYDIIENLRPHLLTQLEERAEAAIVEGA